MKKEKLNQLLEIKNAAQSSLNSLQINTESIGTYLSTLEAIDALKKLCACIEDILVDERILDDDEATFQKVDDLLSKRWERIKTTPLNYTEMRNNDVNRLFCQLANLFSNESRPLLKVLMPTLLNEKSNLTQNTLHDLEALDNSVILLSDDGKHVIEILPCMNFFKMTGKLSHTYTEQEKLLSESEIRRIISYSPEAKKLFSSAELLWKLEKTIPTLKSKLNNLIDWLRKGGANGREGGTEFLAGTSTDVAVADFLSFLKDLEKQKPDLYKQFLACTDTSQKALSSYIEDLRNPRYINMFLLFCEKTPDQAFLFQKNCPFRTIIKNKEGQFYFYGTQKLDVCLAELTSSLYEKFNFSESISALDERQVSQEILKDIESLGFVITPDVSTCAEIKAGNLATLRDKLGNQSILDTPLDENTFVFAGPNQKGVLNSEYAEIEKAVVKSSFKTNSFHEKNIKFEDWHPLSYELHIDLDLQHVEAIETMLIVLRSLLLGTEHVNELKLLLLSLPEKVLPVAIHNCFEFVSKELRLKAVNSTTLFEEGLLLWLLGKGNIDAAKAMLNTLLVKDRISVIVEILPVVMKLEKSDEIIKSLLGLLSNKERAEVIKILLMNIKEEERLIFVEAGGILKEGLLCYLLTLSDIESIKTIFDTLSKTDQEIAALKILPKVIRLEKSDELIQVLLGYVSKENLSEAMMPLSNIVDEKSRWKAVNIALLRALELGKEEAVLRKISVHFSPSWLAQSIRVLLNSIPKTKRLAAVKANGIFAEGLFTWIITLGHSQPIRALLSALPKEGRLAAVLDILPLAMNLQKSDVIIETLLFHLPEDDLCKAIKPLLQNSPDQTRLQAVMPKGLLQEGLLCFLVRIGNAPAQEALLETLSGNHLSQAHDFLITVIPEEARLKHVKAFLPKVMSLSSPDTKEMLLQIFFKHLSKEHLSEAITVLLSSLPRKDRFLSIMPMGLFQEGLLSFLMAIGNIRAIDALLKELPDKHKVRAIKVAFSNILLLDKDKSMEMLLSILLLGNILAIDLIHLIPELEILQIVPVICPGMIEVILKTSFYKGEGFKATKDYLDFIPKKDVLSAVMPNGFFKEGLLKWLVAMGNVSELRTILHMLNREEQCIAISSVFYDAMTSDEAYVEIKMREDRTSKYDLTKMEMGSRRMQMASKKLELGLKKWNLNSRKNIQELFLPVIPDQDFINDVIKEQLNALRALDELTERTKLFPGAKSPEVIKVFLREFSEETAVYSPQQSLFSSSREDPYCVLRYALDSAMTKKQYVRITLLFSALTERKQLETLAELAPNLLFCFSRGINEEIIKTVLNTFSQESLPKAITVLLTPLREIDRDDAVRKNALFKDGLFNWLMSLCNSDAINALLKTLSEESQTILINEALHIEVIDFAVNDKRIIALLRAVPEAKLYNTLWLALSLSIKNKKHRLIKSLLMFLTEEEKRVEVIKSLIHDVLDIKNEEEREDVIALLFENTSGISLLPLINHLLDSCLIKLKMENFIAIMPFGLFRKGFLIWLANVGKFEPIQKIFELFSERKQKIILDDFLSKVKKRELREKVLSFFDEVEKSEVESSLLPKEDSVTVTAPIMPVVKTLSMMLDEFYQSKNPEEINQIFKSISISLITFSEKSRLKEVESEVRRVIHLKSSHFSLKTTLLLSLFDGEEYLYIVLEAIHEAISSNFQAIPVILSLLSEDKQAKVVVADRVLKWAIQLGNMNAIRELCVFMFPKLVLSARVDVLKSLLEACPKEERLKILSSENLLEQAIVGTRPESCAEVIMTLLAALQKGEALILVTKMDALRIAIGKGNEIAKKSLLNSLSPEEQTMAMIAALYNEMVVGESAKIEKMLKSLPEEDEIKIIVAAYNTAINLKKLTAVDSLFAGLSKEKKIILRKTITSTSERVISIMTLGFIQRTEPYFPKEENKNTTNNVLLSNKK